MWQLHRTIVLDRNIRLSMDMRIDVQPAFRCSFHSRSYEWLMRRIHLVLYRESTRCIRSLFVGFGSCWTLLAEQLESRSMLEECMDDDNENTRIMVPVLVTVYCDPARSYTLFT